MTGHKVYRQHGCERHRTFQTIAKCMFKRAAWIHGEGEYALISWCRPITISLYDDEVDALDAHLALADLGCGGRCRFAPRGCPFGSGAGVGGRSR